jgi:hypothetical protein
MDLIGRPFSGLPRLLHVSITLLVSWVSFGSAVSLSWFRVVSSAFVDLASAGCGNNCGQAWVVCGYAVYSVTLGFFPLLVCLIVALRHAYLSFG